MSAKGWNDDGFTVGQTVTADVDDNGQLVNVKIQPMSTDKLRDAIETHEASRQLGFEQGYEKAWADAVGKIRALLDDAYRRDTTGDMGVRGEIDGLESALRALGAEP